jgi:phage shock protein PspC (stress-responsive transcriptional regulator)
MLGGVAAGVARQFGIDVTLVRVGFAALAIAGIGIPLYLAAWLLIPEDGQDYSIADHVLDDVFGNHVHA